MGQASSNESAASKVTPTSAQIPKLLLAIQKGDKGYAAKLVLQKFARAERVLDSRGRATACHAIAAHGSEDLLMAVIDAYSTAVMSINPNGWVRVT